MRNDVPVQPYASENLPAPGVQTKRPLLARWWIYQRERFPLATHVPLIAAFSFCTLTFSMLARGHVAMPPLKAILVAFGTALLFFLQMRIADEFKDADEDARYRPYRPVPRGLITLRELGAVAVAAGVVQALLALWLSPALLPFLLVTWAYLGLMCREFFVRDWLKAHPATYMWSHMLILPLIDLYGTACDWRVANVAPPLGLGILLFVSFCNGFILEVGRKIRAPEDEEHGVETYSALWGRDRAVLVWLVALVVTAIGAGLATFQVETPWEIVAYAAVVALSFALGLRFLRHPVAGSGKPLELLSGLWTLLLYLSLGAIPLALRLS
ncbi:MAG TPA: UbiA family prenyltransferase [Ktedonobacterales bacterium]|nr:UbiA family prenyltransferase [Ktedonobacterales bacterium]